MKIGMMFDTLKMLILPLPPKEHVVSSGIYMMDDLLGGRLDKAGTSLPPYSSCCRMRTLLFFNKCYFSFYLKMESTF